MYDPITATAGALGLGTLGQLGSSLIGARASNKASQQAYDASMNATQAQLEMTAPWREAGSWSLNELKNLISRGPGNFYTSPGYQWRQGEGINALQQGAASRGKLLSGQTQKGLMNYGQNLASGEYQNWLTNWYQSLSPYQSMAGQGMASTQNTANQVGQNILAGGQAQAAGTMGQGNTWANFSNFLGNQFGQLAMQNMLGGGGGGGVNRTITSSSTPWEPYNPYTA